MVKRLAVSEDGIRGPAFCDSVTDRKWQKWGIREGEGAANEKDSTSLTSFILPLRTPPPKIRSTFSTSIGLIDGDSRT